MNLLAGAAAANPRAGNPAAPYWQTPSVQSALVVSAGMQSFGTVTGASPAQVTIQVERPSAEGVTVPTVVPEASLIIGGFAPAVPTVHIAISVKQTAPLLLHVEYEVMVPVETLVDELKISFAPLL